MLQDILNAACAALLLSPYALLPSDSKAARITWIIEHHSYVDEEALDDLSAITKRYWGLSKNASIDLLSGIVGHFSIITQLLKESHNTAIYEKLCELASENALLLGKTFHDIREYDLAWEYYKFSLKIAQDAHNTDLWVNGIGRIALLLIYWGQPQNALPLLHQAQSREIHNQRLRPWLAAIEAEVHAMMGNIDACRRALDLTKKVNLPLSLTDDIYGTGFNSSRAAGYEGACFMRLHKPELALPALKRAFALCDPAPLRRRSTLLADIGTVHAQLGDFKTASALILQSLDMTDQTKSLVVLQRIYKARAELDPWRHCSEVKILDERVVKTFNTLTKIKEQV
jgi:tetratricopeptide (TPR) repeat protein